MSVHSKIATSSSRTGAQSAAASASFDLLLQAEALLRQQERTVEPKRDTREHLRADSEEVQPQILKIDWAPFIESVESPCPYDEFGMPTYCHCNAAPELAKVEGGSHFWHCPSARYDCDWFMWYGRPEVLSMELELGGQGRGHGCYTSAEMDQFTQEAVDQLRGEYFSTLIP
jgi:hypothetical protein